MKEKAFFTVKRRKKICALNKDGCSPEWKIGHPMLTKSGVLRQNHVSPITQRQSFSWPRREKSDPLTKPCTPPHSRREKSRSLLRPVSMVTSQRLTMWRQLGLLKGKIFNRDQATERPKKGQLIPRPREETPGITGLSLSWEKPWQVYQRNGWRREDKTFWIRLAHHLAPGKAMMIQKEHRPWTDVTLESVTWSKVIQLHKVQFPP